MHWQSQWHTVAVFIDRVWFSVGPAPNGVDLSENWGEIRVI